MGQKKLMGSVVDLLSPKVRQSENDKETPESKFIEENYGFLSNNVATEVYQAKQKEYDSAKAKDSRVEANSWTAQSLFSKRSRSENAAPQQSAEPQKALAPEAAAPAELESAAQPMPVAEDKIQPAGKALAEKKMPVSENKIRSVQPQNIQQTEPALSSLRPDTIDFS